MIKMSLLDRRACLGGWRYGMVPRVSSEYSQRSRRSSVVERALGKGEVGSSILPGGTRKPHKSRCPALRDCSALPNNAGTSGGARGKIWGICKRFVPTNIIAKTSYKGLQLRAPPPGAFACQGARPRTRLEAGDGFVYKPRPQQQTQFEKQ